MEPVASCVSGFFMAFLLLQITVLIQAMSSDIQINIRVPDGEGVLVECTSESLILHTEMAWRDSKGNIIPHSSKWDSEDRAELMHAKSSIFIKNRTEGPISCSIYNVTTNQEKKRSIVLPDVLFQPQYMSMMSSGASPPVTYLIIMVILYCLREIIVFYCLKWINLCEFMEGSKKMRFCCKLAWECLPLALYIGFLPLYFNFRRRASILDTAYPLYSNWLCDVCTILVVMMVFFTVIILSLLCSLKCTFPGAPNQEVQGNLELEDEAIHLRHLPQDSVQQRSPVLVHRSCREENFYFQGICVEENFHQPQGSCEENILLQDQENSGKEISLIQPLKLHCSFD